MTLVLKTKSHGEVDSGFSSSDTQFARIGDYSFETRDLCRLIEFLAKDSRLKESKICAYLSLENKAINSEINIPVRIEEDVHLGKYIIETHDFAHLAVYFVNGGFLGWTGKKPYFAKSAIQAIRTSTNPIFKEI